ncbi:MAG: lysylphosphatidylglycerol synthase transmembrane domain-containing protein [Thermoplasmatota archaeon]
MDWKKYIKDGLYVGLGLFLIAVLVLRADATDTMDLLSKVDLSLIGLVIGLYFLNTFCKVIRWYGLLKGMGAKKTGPVVLPIFLASLALNNSTPGKVGGEPVRALMLKEHTGTRGSLGIATIFAEKSLDILMILSFAVLGLIYMVMILGFEDVKAMVLMVGAGGILIITVIAVFLNRRMIQWARSLLQKGALKLSGGNRGSRSYKMLSSLSSFLDRFYRSLWAIRKDPSRGAGVVLMTVAIWFNEAVRLFLVLQAIPGDHSISFPGAIAAIAVANILGFILPIGSGNVIGSASVLELLAGDELLATAASLLQVATSLWISIPLGIISLLFLRIRGKKREDGA